MAVDPTLREGLAIKGFTQSWRMMVLTFSLIGLQFTWAVEMTYFTPYLLQLGLAKNQTSLVWVAAPLSGLIVQPIIGVVSDSSKFRWGRRRPYMLAGSTLVALCLLTLGWAPELVNAFIDDNPKAEKVTVALAVFCIYAVDFSINIVQSCCRSLIVDTLSTSQQHLGSAWAARMSGAGHLMGYATSTFDLSKVFGKSLGGTQFQQLCIITSTMLLSCVGFTCYSVKEKVFVSTKDNEANLGIWGVFSTIFEKARHLPTRIADVCWISFWAWIGWSPFFFYGSTWVGETYYRQSAQTAAELTKSSDVLGDIARKGSSALVLFTLMSFIGSIVLPMIVDSPTHDSSPASRKRLLSVNNDTLTKYLPNLTTAWGLSQILFSASLILAPFSHSFRFATSIITLCGIPWAMTGWAPLAIMGVEINTLSSTTSARHAYTRLSIDDSRPTMELTTQNHASSNHSSHHASRNPSPHDDYEPYCQPTDEPYSPPSEVAGIYLGILNIFCTIPQFLGTFISMVAFSILEPGKSPELGGGEVKKVLGGLSGTAVCLAIGAVCSGIAALRIFRMRKA